MKSFVNGFLTTMGVCCALSIFGMFGLSLLVVITDGGRL